MKITAPDPDGPQFFECRSCSIAWHPGNVNPAPACCPNCGRPWDVAPLFVPIAETEK